MTQTSKETPLQTVISIGPIAIVTSQTIPTNFFAQYVLGGKFKRGKTMVGIHPTSNFYPSWTPNTWNSMCIILSENKISLYLNNKLIDELDKIIFPVNKKYDIRSVNLVQYSELMY